MIILKRNSMENCRWLYTVAILCLYLSTAHGAYDKVLVITHNFNQPDFIEIQHKLFQKFLQDDYEFVVFNDANCAQIAQKIADTCARNNISCIRIPQEIHDRPYLARIAGDPYHRPNIRHANVLQYSLDVLGFDFDGIVAIVDSDLFLVKPLSVNAYMEQYDMLAVPRGAPDGIVYAWPGTLFFNMKRLPDRKTINLNCGFINGHSVDSGGYMHHYLRKHPQVRVRWVSELQGGSLFCPDRFGPVAQGSSWQADRKNLKKRGFDDVQIEFLQKKPDTIGFILDHHFLHYRAGSNYDNMSDHYCKRKLQLISTYLDKILAS